MSDLRKHSFEGTHDGFGMPRGFYRAHAHRRCCGLDVNTVQHEGIKVYYDAAAAVSIVTASDLPLPCSVQVTWSEPSLKKAHTHTHGFSKAKHYYCASSACRKNS